MECPKCESEQPDEGTECLRCGIVYEKYLAHQKRLNSGAESTEFPGFITGEFRSYLSGLFFSVPSEVNVFHFVGRVIMLVIIFFWGIKFIFTPMEANYSGSSFLHLVNLPFHEAGHILFRPLGKFMMTLGGSLTQLLIPVICMIAFLIKTRDTFAASVCLWWFGESLMDLAPYINDARELRLILLGGVTGRDVDDYHDWEFILRKMGWLQYDHFLANAAYSAGIFFMLCTFIWGGFLLCKQFRNVGSEFTKMK